MNTITRNMRCIIENKGEPGVMQSKRAEMRIGSVSYQVR